MTGQLHGFLFLFSFVLQGAGCGRGTKQLGFKQWRRRMNCKKPKPYSWSPHFPETVETE